MRFYTYYSAKNLIIRNSAIHKALLKYGYSNFSLDILEYCDKADLFAREQYYIDLLKPEYNMLQVAGSSLGYKHKPRDPWVSKLERSPVSDETKKTLSLAATGRVLTEQDKEKISKSRLGTKLSDETRKKISETTTSLIGVGVKVKNINTNEKLEYSTLTLAAKAIGVSRTAVKKALISNKPIKNLYLIFSK